LSRAVKSLKGAAMKSPPMTTVQQLDVPLHDGAQQVANLLMDLDMQLAQMVHVLNMTHTLSQREPAH
jgi:hypothetical protein